MSSANCLRCQTELLPNARFCSCCTFQAKFDTQPAVSGSEWTANAAEFAVRIRPENLKAWFSKGLNVDESQTGLLFESGRFTHELTSGRQKLESLPDRIRSYVTGEKASAVLIRKGLFPLSVLGRGLTPEGDEVSFDCEIGLQIGDRNTFYINMMQSADQVTAGDLMQKFGGVARQAMFSVIGRCGSAELLNVHPELQQRMVDAVADAVEPVAARWGMTIGYVSPPAFSNKQLAEFQRERSLMIRELRSEKLKQQFSEDKDEIEIRRFQAARALADAKIKDAIEEAERTQEFDKVKAELRHSQTLHGLQLAETMDAAVDSFAARNRQRTDTKDDNASLRAHLLAVAEVGRERELANLTFGFRKESLQQQHELDDVSRGQKIKTAQEELDAEIQRLNATQIGQIDRWRRQREAQRQDRLADAEVQAKTTQVVGDSDRDKAAKDFDENHRQQGAGIDLEAIRINKLSEAQATHLGRLQDVQRKEQENQSAAERSSHELAEDSKERERKGKMDELLLLKDGPEIMQLLKMAEIAVQSPAMSAAFGDVMKMAVAKGMTGEQLEQVMASQSPEVAKALQEKYRMQAAAAGNVAEVERAAFERLIAELKSAQQLSADQMKDFVARLENMGIRTHEVLADVGIAAGSRGDQPGKPLDAKQLKDLTDKVEELKRKMDGQNPQDET